MNSSRSKSEDSRVKIVTTECSGEVKHQKEVSFKIIFCSLYYYYNSKYFSLQNASFLAIKFEKLLVSKNTSKIKPGVYVYKDSLCYKNIFGKSIIKSLNPKIN